MQVPPSNLLEPLGPLAATRLAGPLVHPPGNRAVLEFIGAATSRTETAQQTRCGQLQAQERRRRNFAPVRRQLAEENVLLVIDQTLQQPDRRLHLVLSHQIASLQQSLHQTTVGHMHHPRTPIDARQTSKGGDLDPDLSGQW